MLSWPLQVMESVVKNCGQTVHDEVANKQTMEELKEILKVNRFILLAFFFLWKSSSSGKKCVCSLLCLLWIRSRRETGNALQKRANSCGV